ncbi:MAG: Rpn family recombination-promoting nuclease/putative transposase [Clostridia bacterium]|nr:Rpn family recombination-promoting nuclease/putative transposase [Clostridia bacterium]MBQ4143017.1 Rpn family recombination-promoting nuclease/putative transposase [Thermoguttaceae bacterium]
MSATRNDGKAKFHSESALKPTADVIFQYIFGAEGCEEILLGFLNAIRKHARQSEIVDVKIQNPFNIKEKIEDKSSILDLKVTDENGNIFNVEMQTFQQSAFDKRVLYYWSKLYSGQIQDGENYEILRPVTSVIISTFRLFPEHNRLHSVHEIRDVDQPEVQLLRDFQFYFLELTPEKWEKFCEENPHDAQPTEVSSALYLWLYFLQNADMRTEEEMGTLVKKTDGLDQAYRRFRKFNSTDTMREKAEMRQKFLRDQYAIQQFQLQKEREEGRAEGIREMLNTVLQFRFNEIPADVECQLSDISDIKRLQHLSLCAATLPDLDSFMAELQK